MKTDKPSVAALIDGLPDMVLAIPVSLGLREVPSGAWMADARASEVARRAHVGVM